MEDGLTNTPAIFQALVNDVLRDTLNAFVFVYLDNIQIYSENSVEHAAHVRQVLQRLLENPLYVKAEKCEFHCQATCRSHLPGSFHWITPVIRQDPILTVINRFCKASYFVPLTKLPSAKETTDKIIQFIFRLRGLF